MKNPNIKKERSGLSSYSRAIRNAGPLFGSGIQLAASVILMFFLGRWLDGKFQTDPWLMILGIMFGLGAGLYNFIKIAGSFNKKTQQDDENAGR